MKDDFCTVLIALGCGISGSLLIWCFSSLWFSVNDRFFEDLIALVIVSDSWLFQLSFW